MALLTAEECRAHCRVINAGEDHVLLAMLASAEDAAVAYLNRAIYETQEALDADLAALPDAAATAQADYDAAVVAAEAETNAVKAESMLEVAYVKLVAAQRSAARAINGIVVNPSILAAVKMTMGHLYENREAVVAGVTVAEVPHGVHALLRPYRRVMMP